METYQNFSLLFELKSIFKTLFELIWFKIEFCFENKIEKELGKWKTSLLPIFPVRPAQLRRGPAPILLAWPSISLLPSGLEAQQPSRPPEPSSQVGPLFLPLGPLHLSSFAACFPLHPRGLSLSRPSFLSLPKAAAIA